MLIGNLKEVGGRQLAIAGVGYGYIKTDAI